MGINEYRSESYLRFDNYPKSSVIQKIRFIIKKNNGIFVHFYRKLKLNFLYLK